MSPYLGWIESFSLVVACWSIAAAVVWQSVTAIAQVVSINALLAPGSAWTWWASFFSNSVNFALVGVLEVAVLILFISSPPRKVYWMILVIAVLAVVALPVFPLAMIGVTPEGFAVNFSKIAGQDVGTLLSNAETAGFELGQQSGLQAPNMFLLWTWILLLFSGYTWTAYMAGELKGNIARNVAWSIGLSLLGNMLWCGMLPVLFMKTIGYDFAAAWGWMSFNAPSSLPGGTLALAQVIAIIARPELSPLFTFASIFFAIMPPFLTGVLFTYMPTRIVFAWSMDRLAPAAMTKIGKRTGQPTYTLVLAAIALLIFFAWTVMGVSPLNTAWFGALVLAPSWIFPGLNCLLLPYRRPELYKRAAWKYNIGRVPLCAIFGLISAAVFGAVMVGAYFYPILIRLLMTPSTLVYEYAVSSGIIPTIAAFIAGTIYYVAVRWIQRRRGIDLSLIYKSVPPE